MDRRTFIRTVIGGLLGVPLASGAQERSVKVARIGFLGVGSASSFASRTEALRAGLRDLGYVDGKNIVIEFRWADGKYDRLPALANELVRLKVDALVTYGTPGTLAAKHATSTIPIVMATSGDAVAVGLVTSLARPGGNITGSTFFSPELSAKRLELLKEAMPRITRVAFLLNPDNPLMMRRNLQVMGMTAGSLMLELQPFEVREPNEFDDVFAAMAKRRVDAVLIDEDPIYRLNVETIAGIAAKQRLPSIGFSEFAEAGGMMSYGPNLLELWRRVAYFVDKILRGATPADLPVEQPTKFELVINLKTAKALGLTIPQSLLLRADGVIQ